MTGWEMRRGKVLELAVSAGADPRRGLFRGWRPTYKHLAARTTFREHGHTIDHLFYFILWLTGVVFVVTEVVLFWFPLAVRRRDTEPRRSSSRTAATRWKSSGRSSRPSTLLFIAIYQMNAWADVEDAQAQGHARPTVEVTGRQFEWRLRYPGPGRQARHARTTFTS